MAVVVWSMAVVVGLVTVVVGSVAVVVGSVAVVVGSVAVVVGSVAAVVVVTKGAGVAASTQSSVTSSHLYSQLNRNPLTWHVAPDPHSVS